MTSLSRTCIINECKRPSRAVCLCCQKHLCRDHLKEHDELINAQLPPLADQINVLSDQLNSVALLEPSCLTDLSQWRENAHRIVDQFYEGKRRQFEQFIQERTDKQRRELEKTGATVNELLREQDATKEQVDLITDSIQSVERSVNDLQHMRLNNSISN